MATSNSVLGPVMQSVGERALVAALVTTENPTTPFSHRNLNKPELAADPADNAMVVSVSSRNP